MDNLEEQKQPRRHEYSPSVASNDGDGLLQSKAVTESNLTDMKLKAVTQGFRELEIYGMAILCSPCPSMKARICGFLVYS